MLYYIQGGDRIHSHLSSAELSRSSHTSFFFGHEKNIVFTSFRANKEVLSNSEEKLFSKFCSSLSHLNILMPFFLVF